MANAQNTLDVLVKLGITATVPITSANLGVLTLVRRDAGTGNVSFVINFTIQN